MRTSTALRSRSRWQFGRALVALFVLTVIAGAVPACGRADDEGGTADSGAAAERGSGALAYPAELSAASSPSDVARVLIRALENDEKATLLGLVAVEALTADIDRIFRGRQPRGMPDPPIGLAVAGWGASYAFFEKGTVEVTRETADGDTAVVFARGTLRNGDSQTLKITLLREGGLWKVRPGIETLVR